MDNHIVTPSLSFVFLFVVLFLFSFPAFAAHDIPHTTHKSQRPHSQRLTVSSRKACRLDLDCGRDAYCGPRTSLSPTATAPGLCTPRLAVNKSCPDPNEADACKPELFCAFESIDFTTGPKRKCRPRPRLGQDCGFKNLEPCVSPLVCDSSSSKCRASRNSLQNGKCEVDRDCQSNKGLFCDVRNRVCKPVKKFGVACASSSARDPSCPGYCRIMQIGPFTAQYFCRKQAPLGSVCTEDQQCAFSKFTNPRADRAVCNRFTRDYGVCAMYSKLKKRVGERCNRRVDLCDHGRGLSCRWASKLKTTVCQHYHTLATQAARQFCEIGNPLSRCPSPDSECRYAQEGRETLNSPLAFPMCYPRRIYLPPGSRCEFERARCKNGSRCRVIPGVTRQPPGSLRPGLPSKYCVMVRGVGGMCKNKFYGQCRDGLTCVGGVCMKQERPKKVQVTHSGLRGNCEKLPCAPGLKCRPSNFGAGKACLPPRVVTGIWKPCGFNPLKEIVCKDWLACRADANGRGKKLCRPRAMVGAFCEDDNRTCRKGLKCAIQTSQGRFLEDSRCFNPKNMLPLGAKCSPPMTRSDRQCVPKLSGEFGRRCLPQGDGFACQIDVGLFGMCDAKKNRVCGDRRLTCSKAGICVSKN